MVVCMCVLVADIDRVSTTPGNLPEFEIVPANTCTGNLLEFS